MENIVCGYCGLALTKDTLGDFYSLGYRIDRLHKIKTMVEQDATYNSDAATVGCLKCVERTRKNFIPAPAYPREMKLKWGL